MARRLAACQTLASKLAQHANRCSFTPGNWIRIDPGDAASLPSARLSLDRAGRRGRATARTQIEQCIAGMYGRIHLLALLAVAAAALGFGCTSMRTSDTARTGQEQLLISNAVDQALNKVPFGDLSGQAVFLDQKYMENAVDKGYVIASMRERLMTSGATLVDSAEDADVVMEVRSGGIGTDNSRSFVGVPKVALPGPIPFEMPEIRFWSKDSQTGIAKIGVVAYDANSKQMLGRGGKVIAKSEDVGTTFLGVGPWYKGSIRDEVKLATRDDKKAEAAIEEEYTTARGPIGVRTAEDPSSDVPR